MPPIHFKLNKSDDHTRRATFQELPTWPELASKLQLLYGVPIDKVAVAYVDSDHDEITASSNEELQDFYQSSFQPGHVIKLTVLDLSVRRDNSSPTTPALNRNTFGQDNFEFVDVAWSGLNNLGIANFVDGASEGPHAFVEVLSSDAGGLAKDQEDTTDTDSENDRTVLPPPANKGKGKMSSFGAASTTSVVAEEVSHKYPVHVFDHSVKRAASSAGSALGASNINADHIAAQSTPRVQPVEFGNSDLDTQQMASAKAAEIEDPPLPSFDGPPASNASASLSNDVATLLNMFTDIISSHPELSEGIRNIVRNASNGTYWQPHRSALSDAANEMSQAAGEAKNLEEEASRRISEALGGILRSFTQATNTEQANGGTSQPAQQQQPFSTYRGPPPHFNRRPWARRSTTALDAHRPWFAGWHIPPWGMQSPHGPPPPGPPHLNGYQMPHFAHDPPPPSPRHPPPSHGPPPPPPPPPHSSPPPPPPSGPPPPPPPPPPAPTPRGPPHGPPQPPPPPFHRHSAIPHSRPFPHPGPHHHHQPVPHSHGGHPGHGSPADGPTSTAVEAEQIDPNDLMGQLKLAKKRYKDIKEAIRQKEQDENERKKL